MVRKNKVAYTLEERLHRARQLRQEGYVCSQCIVMVFDDVEGLDVDHARLMSAGFGGGFGGQGLVCGAVSAITMIEGVRHWKEPLSKPHVYAGVRRLTSEFQERLGSLYCKELKQSGKKPCMEIIEEAITLMHESLAKDKK